MAMSGTGHRLAAASNRGHGGRRRRGRGRNGDRELGVHWGSPDLDLGLDHVDLGLDLVAPLSRLASPWVPGPQLPGAECHDQCGEGQADADVDEARGPHDSRDLVCPRVQERDHRAVGIEHLFQRNAHELQSGKGHGEELDAGNRKDDHQDGQRDRLEGSVTPEGDQ